MLEINQAPWSECAPGLELRGHLGEGDTGKRRIEKHQIEGTCGSFQIVLGAGVHQLGGPRARAPFPQYIAQGGNGLGVLIHEHAVRRAA